MREFTGEKTEQPTPRRLEEAQKRGQFARSPEVQTVFVLMAGLVALLFTGSDMWRQLAGVMTGTLGHLHEIPVASVSMQRHLIAAALAVATCVWPVLAAIAVSGLLAGGIQSRFRTAPEALTADWGRLNPVNGFKRIFSPRAAVPTGIAVLKLAVILTLSYSVIQSVFTDPIFYTSVDLARIGGFMADSAFKIVSRVVFALVLLAAMDYGYQLWRTHQDMMMTREELKEEMKHQEANPQVKSRRRRLRQSITKRKMLLEVPMADVVVTNPTHLAVALRYDRKTMRAPRIVAKGSRLNAQRIREIAEQHQVPVIENKPLARMLFKHGPVGGEIPARLYAAVAEILAYVYRVNAYRYYREQSLN